MKDRGFFWKGEEVTLGESRQKTASSKCGSFLFFLDPDTDVSLLELKDSFLA